MEEQQTKEWFAQRRSRVTGSNVGAILGLNPYRSADDVMRAMVRDHCGADTEFTGNVATEHGSFHEDGAAVEYQMETGNRIQPCGFFVHPRLEWLGASPDGLVGDDGLVEIKCPYGKRKDEKPEFKTAKEQPHYWAQVQIEMACAQRQWCDFFQWAPSGTVLERIYPDQEWLDETIPKLRAFYDRFIVELENPDHLQPRRKVVESPEARKLVDEIADLDDQIAFAQQRRKYAMDALIELCGSVDALVCGHKLTRVDRVGTVAYAKIVKDKLPELDVEPWRGKGSVSWRLT
jgi:putative phage-type endonuclease